MTVRLVDAGWGTELTAALRADRSEFRVVCPFIKAGALDGLLSHTSPLKKASLTGFHATAKHIAAKAVSPSSETMRTI